MIRIIAISIAALALLTGCGPQSSDATYYLVRHAEKQLDVKDPPLTPEGEMRAQDLSQRLSDVNLTDIYSTDYVRTQATAAPTASAKNLTVMSYDPSDLPGFAKVLLAREGVILVAGHSNTTPQLAELLGADPGTEIDEATEYNRLYVIERRGDKIEGRIETFGK